MASIQETGEKIKRTMAEGVDQWGSAVIVILIAFSCFGLGRLSVLQEAKTPISVSQAASAAPALALGGSYVAARTGSVYYFPWCSGAESIKPVDQIWFKTEEAAQKASFRPAKNCKGLSS